MSDASSVMSGVTDYPELNELLDEFVGHLQSILGDDLVGAYLTGGFALGAGDLSSDCDFVVVTERRVTEDQEQALRALHDEIPTRPGYWAINFEGSYAPKADLASLERMDREWLYIARGWREMEWSTHCNVVDTRWVLRERGVTLIGPDPRTFACEVPADMLRKKMREYIDGFLPYLESWASFDLFWTQRYAVETVCRMLYTFATGEVESKRASLEWALQELPAAWHDLIQHALTTRSVKWNDPADPARVAEAIAFADYAKGVVGSVPPPA